MMKVNSAQEQNGLSNRGYRSDLGSNAIWESCESIHIASREIQEKKRAPLL